jgi:hypothetical protein
VRLGMRGHTRWLGHSSPLSRQCPVLWKASLNAAARIPASMAMRPIPAIEVKPPQIFPRTLCG